MPIIRLSWDDIKSKLAGATQLIALTDRQASMLQGIARQLEWRASFEDGEYDFSDYDDLQHEVADLLRGLQMGVDLADLFSKLDEILAAIDQIDDLVGGPACCPDDLVFEAPPEYTWSEGVPQAIIDAGFATGTGDEEGYASYRCMAAHALLNNTQRKLLALEPFLEAAFVVFGIVGLLLGSFVAASGAGAVITLGGLAIDAGAVIALVTSLKSVIAGEPTSWSEQLEDDRDTIVCATLQGDGLAGVKAAFVAAVADSIGTVGGGVVSLLNLDNVIQLTFYGTNNGVNGAQWMADNGLDPADYNCPCEADVSVLFTFDSDAQDWAITGQFAGYDADYDAINFGNGSPDGVCSASVATVNAHAQVGSLAVASTYRFRTVTYIEGHRPNNAPNPGTTYDVRLMQTGSGTAPALAQAGIQTENTEYAPVTERVIDVSSWPDVTIGATTHVVMRFTNPSGNGRAIVDSILIELDLVA